MLNPKIVVWYKFTQFSSNKIHNIYIQPSTQHPLTKTQNSIKAINSITTAFIRFKSFLHKSDENFEQRKFQQIQAILKVIHIRKICKLQEVQKKNVVFHAVSIFLFSSATSTLHISTLWHGAPFQAKIKYITQLNMNRKKNY